MTYKFSNNVSTLLYEELSPKASEMKVHKLPEGIHWPIINTAENEVAPCTVIDPRTRAWEIMYIKEIIEGPTYDTLKITRGEEETGPNFFNKKSRVEIRVTAAVLNDYYAMQVATPTRKGIVQVGERLDVTSDGILSTPLATTTTEGTVKIGDRLLVDEGTISVPLATDEVTGVIKVGENLTVDTEGTLSVPNASTSEAGVVKLSDNFSIDDDGNLILPIATTTDTGIVKIGDRLVVDTDGTLSAPLASDTEEGMVKIGDGLELDEDGALTTVLPIATDTELGVVIAGDNLTIDDGKLSADAETIVQSQIDDTQASEEHPWSGAKIQEELDNINTELPSIATEDTVGIIKPDGITTIVDNVGMLSVLGGNLLVNTEEWITESGEWIAPVTGWYEVLLIGGGHSGYGSAYDWAMEAYGGHSGALYLVFLYFNAGDTIPVNIGSGGVPYIVQAYPMQIGQGAGSHTTFGDYSTTSGYRLNAGLSGRFNLKVSTSYIVRSLHGSGGGYGGGHGTWDANKLGTKAMAEILPESNGAFYGAGGGAYSHQNGPYVSAGSGVQGAVRIRYYDPSKSLS